VPVVGRAAGPPLDPAALFDASPVPCVVLAPRGFTIVAVNEAVLRATGAGREELVGRPLFALFPANPADPLHGERTPLRAALRSVTRSKEPAVLPAVRYDVPATSAPQGFEERWWSPVVAPVLGAAGELEYLVVQVEDVTSTMRPAASGGGAPEHEATIARLRQSNLALARETEMRRRSEEQLRRAAALDAYRVRLNDALSRCSEPATALATALEVMAERLGVDVAYFGEVDHESGSYVVDHGIWRDGHVSPLGRYRLGDYPAATERLGRGEDLVVEDAGSDPDLDERVRTAMLSHGFWSLVAAPLVRSGRWVGIMTALGGEPRAWRPDEVALVAETAQRAWTAAEALRAERLLRQSAETFESLVVNAPFGVYVVDSDLRIALASRTAHEAFGSPPEVVGRRLEDVLSARWSPEVVAFTAETFERTLETGEPFRSKDTVQRRADRDDVEAYDWRLERVVLPNGRPGVVCYFYELTERQRLEDLLRQREEELRRLNASLEREVAAGTEELRHSEARFRHAFADGPVAACIATLEDDRLLEVNLAFERLTGYAAAEAVGRPAAELGLWSSPEDAARIAAALEGADGYRDLELKVTRKDGEVIDVLASASLINWGGEPVRLKMFIDNTANKRAQEQVSRAIKDVIAEAAWFSRNVVERLSRAGDTGRRLEPTPELTPREQQVLARIALGMTDRAIAEELGVTHQTVRNHVARIYAKIKVHSRSQAVVWAREKGIPGSAVAPT
jgi:PAS domain S-box-containing protein